jgi:hypothetical protein
VAQQIEQLPAPFPAEQRHARFTFTLGEAGYLAEAMLTPPPSPHLDAIHTGNGRARFFDVLRPLRRQLRSHAHRELTIAQLEGTIPPGELTVGDLLDDVTIRAWDRWPDGPRDQPADRWLVGLLHGVLDARGLPYTGSARAPPVSPCERRRDGIGVEHSPVVDDPPQGNNPKATHVVENGWAVENNPYWPYVDSLTPDDVLPGDGSPEGVQLLTAEEQRRAILDEPSRFSRDARRARSRCTRWTVGV